MSEALNAVLEQAEAAAANHTAAAPATSTALTQVAPAAGALAPLGQPSLDAFMNSAGLAVDLYINVKNTGVSIGESREKLETIPVILDMMDVTPVYVARVELNGNTDYIKSYDGRVTTRGQDFQSYVALRERTNGAKSSGIYQTAEIPVELAEDLKTSKGALIAEAGTTLGFTPSLTGFKEFQQFYKKLQKTNPGALQSRIRLNLNAKMRTKGQNEWFVLDFEFVGIAAD